MACPHAQITVVAAAGNGASDSCGAAPGSARSAIVVAASDLTTKFGSRQPRPDTEQGPPDGVYQYSNTGACVDLFRARRGHICGLRGRRWVYCRRAVGN